MFFIFGIAEKCVKQKIRLLMRATAKNTIKIGDSTLGLSGFVSFFFWGGVSVGRGVSAEGRICGGGLIKGEREYVS